MSVERALNALDGEHLTSPPRRSRGPAPAPVDERRLVRLELLLAHVGRELLEDRAAHVGLDARQRLDDRQAAERDELGRVAALVRDDEAAVAQPGGGVDDDLREPAEAARARASSGRAGPSRWRRSPEATTISSGRNRSSAGTTTCSNAAT